MNPSDFIMLLLLGLPVGALLLVLSSGTERLHIRKAIARWCLFAGGVCASFAVASMVAHLDFTHGKIALGMIVGLPSLSAGVLLHLFSRQNQPPVNTGHDSHA